MELEIMEIITVKARMEIMDTIQGKWGKSRLDLSPETPGTSAVGRS
jgi:hypothetical protein